MMCVDNALEAHSASSDANDNGQLLYLAEFRSGSIDEGAYPDGVEPGCSLCGVKTSED